MEQVGWGGCGGVAWGGSMGRGEEVGRVLTNGGQR
jgi:hypothetical protein